MAISYFHSPSRTSIFPLRKMVEISLTYDEWRNNFRLISVQILVIQVKVEIAHNRISKNTLRFRCVYAISSDNILLDILEELFIAETMCV